MMTWSGTWDRDRTGTWTGPGHGTGLGQDRTGPVHGTVRDWDMGPFLRAYWTWTGPGHGTGPGHRTGPGPGQDRTGLVHTTGQQTLEGHTAVDLSFFFSSA